MIKNIRVYDNEAYLVNELRPEISAGLNPDETRALMHVNDYEGLSYIVVNDDNVIVIEDISGDVVEQCSVDEFIDQALAYIREEQ